MSVEEDIQKMKAMQPQLDEQIRGSLGLIPEELLARVLQFETTEAFTAWRKKSDAAPPCIVLDGRIFYVLEQLRAWLPSEFRKQNAPEPNMTTPPGNTVTPPFTTHQGTREEFVPPPQRRDYSKGLQPHLQPMDEHNNKYEAAREEKERQAREQEEKLRQQH